VILISSQGLQLGCIKSDEKMGFIHSDASKGVWETHPNLISSKPPIPGSLVRPSDATFSADQPFQKHSIVFPLPTSHAARTLCLRKALKALYEGDASL
jgi:hypothetical protein